MPTCNPTSPTPSTAPAMPTWRAPTVSFNVALRSHRAQARRLGNVLLLVAIPVDDGQLGTVQRRIRSTDTLLQTPGGVAVVPVAAPSATQAADIARLIAERFARLRLGVEPKVLAVEDDLASAMAECEAARFAPA